MRYIGRLLIAVVLVVAACGNDRTETFTTTPSSTTTTVTPPTTLATAPETTSTTSTTVITMTTTTTTTAPPAPPVLHRGDWGADVAAVQQRLRELGYWFTDGVDGTYDDSTAHAVTAFQKRSGLEPDGVVGPLTASALDGATRPTGFSSTGYIAEIDLATQTLLLVDGGTVRWVFDVSTGARSGTTPRGHWTVFRQVNGYDRSPLGVLYRPKYFSGGVAVHGYPSVPPAPASHGCVRVINSAMDWLWATGSLAIGTNVWVY